MGLGQTPTDEGEPTAPAKATTSGLCALCNHTLIQRFWVPSSRVHVHKRKGPGAHGSFAHGRADTNTPTSPRFPKQTVLTQWRLKPALLFSTGLHTTSAFLPRHTVHGKERQPIVQYCNEQLYSSYTERERETLSCVFNNILPFIFFFFSFMFRKLY